MRRILNEMARMKKIAGIISENKYEEGADMATSEEITMEGDEVTEADRKPVSADPANKLPDYADPRAQRGVDKGDFIRITPSTKLKVGTLIVTMKSLQFATITGEDKAKNKYIITWDDYGDTARWSRKQLENFALINTL